MYGSLLFIICSHLQAKHLSEICPIDDVLMDLMQWVQSSPAGYMLTAAVKCKLNIYSNFLGAALALSLEKQAWEPKTPRFNVQCP